MKSISQIIKMWSLYIKINIYCIYWENGKIWKHVSVQSSHLLIADSMGPHGLQQTRLPCPSPTPRACSNSCPSSRWCHTTISSCHPLLLPLSIFPSGRGFSMVQFFASCGQSIRVPALTPILPMNIPGWFSLRCTGWISLQSKGLSRVFSNTTVQKHQFFSTQLSL